MIDTPVKYLKKLVPLLAKPILSKIHHLKDAYKGEECYLIGDGISLKWFDLRSFTDKLCIPCGELPFHKDFHILNIEQCILIDPYSFYPLMKTTSPPIKYIKNSFQQSYRLKIKENPQKIKIIWIIIFLIILILVATMVTWTIWYVSNKHSNTYVVPYEELLTEGRF